MANFINEDVLNIAMQNIINQNIGASASDALTTVSKNTFDDRYANHVFTYAPDYVVGGFGLPKPTDGGPSWG